MQHDIFLGGEGDAWYGRNKDALASRPDDLLTKYLLASDLEGKKILDIGCGNGHRLSLISGERYGIDPSAEAVCSIAPPIKAQVGVSHQLDYPDALFDVVIISFVFHWLDRSVLLKTVSEIDRVLKDSGTLCIMDFYPDRPHKRRYHHREDVELFTYKQDYSKLFLESGIYQLESKTFFMHPDLTVGAEITDFDNGGFLAVLRHDLG
jgi:SAM-dependent methyltransferase